MSVSEAVKLEREKRKTAREARLWELLDNQAVQKVVLPAVALAATYKLGETRAINRDLGGFLFAMEAVLAAAANGVTDRWALGAIATSATAIYAIAVPPTESEALLEIHPSKLLGGDSKLFFIDMTQFGLPENW